MTLASTDLLIGRARELKALRDLAGEVASGSAATVVIEGGAGIGKTRLLANLIDVARERGFVVFHGEAHPLERIRPFGVFVDALDLRPASADPRRAALGRLLGVRDPVAGGELAAGQLQFRMIEEIIDLIEVTSDRRSVLVALDDLHWADASTLLAFRWTMRELTQVPLMLVATLRPLPRGAELGRLLDDCLDAGVSAEVASPAMPDSLRQLVVRRLGYLPEGTVATLRSASILGEAFSLVDLVRDAVYEDIPESARIAMHREAARTLEAAGIAEDVLARPHADEVVGVLRFALIDALSLQNRAEELIDRTAFLLGEWEEAEPELEAGVEAAREHGNLIVVPRARGYLALIAASVPSVQSAARRCRGLVGRDPDAMLESVELAGGAVGSSTWREPARTPPRSSGLEVGRSMPRSCSRRRWTAMRRSQPIGTWRDVAPDCAGSGHAAGAAGVVSARSPAGRA